MQEDILRKNGLKVTESRKWVLKVLSEKPEPMSADDVYKQIIAQYSMDYSTVYRILSILTEKNITIKSVQGDGIAYYQLNDSRHNHYLVCSECHKRIPIEGCPLHEISEELVERTGFHITGHNLEFVGECPECMKKKDCDKGI
jgi:Fur family ferric uptake transcriptional regulator